MDTSQAFLEMIRRHGEKAYNFAYRLSGNEQDARDLVQDALTRAFEHREDYDPDKPFEAWLFRILRNIYLDGVRRYAHKHTVSLDAPSLVEGISWDEVLPGSDPDPEHLMLRQEAGALVQQALNTLPIHYRTAVVLCDIEGLSYERISEVMACPIGTVRSRVHQGRILMRKTYEEFHSHEP